MKKILFVPPDVFVPFYVLVLFYVGACAGIAASAWFLIGPGRTCAALALFALSAALMVPFFWALRRVRPGSAGTRTVVLLIGFSMFMAYLWISCRMAA